METRRYSSSIIIILLILFFPSWCQAGNIRSDRPRLLIDSKDIDRMKSAVQTYSKNDFAYIKINSDSIVKNSTPESLIDSPYSDKTFRNIAFTWLISGEEDYLNKAIDFAMCLARVEASHGNDGTQRPRLLALAYAYDWLYDRLTSEQKADIRTGIIANVEHLKYFAERANFTGGHSRRGNISILAALIALWGDYGTWNGSELLEKEKDLWENGYNPFQSFVASEGGYHMGWGYTAYFTTCEPYLFWEKATGERWGEGWRKEQIYWYIYGIREDESFPHAGDGSLSCAPYASGDINCMAAVSSGLFKNPHAEWFYKTYLDRGSYRVMRMIFQDSGVKSAAPTDPQAPLPLSRSFAHAGYFLSRDCWEGNATQLVFKSAPFYTRNHHHKDQNNIEISYKGPLLIDSGYYDYYGSSHWYNYFTRTIAHNTMVVFDPNEKFVDGKEVSNDGGQKYPDYAQHPVGTEPRTIGDILDDKYKLDGIVDSDFTGNDSWVRGDATKAYNENKVHSYLRDVFFVGKPSSRNKPIILIWDRIELQKNLRPRILFHSDEKPSVGSSTFTIQNSGGGIVHGEIFSPSLSISMELVGGRGKEWWVNGVNYPPTRTPSPSDAAGTWRLEAGPSQSTAEANLLTILAVDDASSFQGRPSVKYVQGTGYAGVVIGEDLYVICDGITTTLGFSGSNFDSVKTIHIAGVKEDTIYSCSFNGMPMELTTEDRQILVLQPNSAASQDNNAVNARLASPKNIRVEFIN